eukprot:TRINITY_DN1552_c0_g1_i4.p1 TRINITY_DN1552_c0_g1~~TRINITY_DN1552_c0_g1_i4.p1  ORF type:complete len:632 (+),score=174.82 TRINITY_DN1552_c0_g1_i4:3112-5007(+)
MDNTESQVPKKLKLWQRIGKRRFAFGFGVFVVGSVAYSAYQSYLENERKHRISGKAIRFERVPQRTEQIQKLKQKSVLDVLVIGGGATGSGVALDAVTRGLTVGLVERDDFAAGTSSRSTKLIHGGVRYLEKAVFQLDWEALTLVFEALHERANFLNNAPHLTEALPIMTPCYKWWEIPFYWAGMKAYDLLAGRQKLNWSRFVESEEALRQFPMLAKKGLKGTVVYYDGQMNDARMNVSLALTAAKEGVAIANHIEVLSLLKDGDKVCGVRVRDTLNSDEWDIKAKVVVNATGPFADSIRKMDNPQAEDLIVPSSGVHVVLPDYYSPDGMGLIVPKTKDGRVVFMLPWQGQTIAGTTDSSTKITRFPHPHEKEIRFILEALSDYLDVQVRRSDVQACWSGIRPLAKDPNALDTKSISRNHVIEVADSQLITITGGKWTTYRKMAEDTVDKVIQVGSFKEARKCRTNRFTLLGGEGWDKAFFTNISQDFQRMKTSKRSSNQKGLVKIPSDIAQHLSHSYGTRAIQVAKIAEESWGNRLVDGHPYLEAEVVYAAQEEMACTAVDVVARRLRLAFLDAEASAACSQRVVDILTDQLGWSKERKAKELADLEYFLHTMNVGRTIDQFNDDPDDQQ